MKVARGDRTKSEEEDGIVKIPGKILGIRHLEGCLLFFGLMAAFAMRANMSVAIVAMTSQNSTDSGITTFPEWTKQKQDTILSSFFWGYVAMQFPSGLIAQKFGQKMLLTVSLSVNGLASILTPFSAIHWGWKAVCACRVLQGLTQAALYPSIQGILSKWVPINERGRLSTYVNAGSSLGTVIELALAGIIGDSLGWPMIFYTTGIAAFIWTILWLFLSADSPAEHRWISEEEKNYIERLSGYSKKTGKTPWKRISTSVPFLALLTVHCGNNWGYYTLFTETPSYLKHVLGVDIKTNGLLSSMPFMALFLTSFIICNISDYIINEKIISRTAARKLFNSIAHWGSAVFLIALSYVPSGEFWTSVILLTLAIGIGSAINVGYGVNHLDLTPNFAPTIMGITNMAANTMSLLAPLAVGAIINDETQASEWRIVFIISAAFYFTGNLIFVIFGSGEKQPWNESKNYDDITVKEDD